MVRFFNALGTPVLAFCQYLGELVLLAGDTFRSIFTHKLRWKLFLNQVVEIGLLSQLVVVITGAFTGAVFAAQTFFQFNKIGMGSATGRSRIVVDLSRAWPGAHSVDGSGPRRRSHVGGNRHNESDRADRCVASTRSLSDRLSGRAASAQP